MQGYFNQLGKAATLRNKPLSSEEDNVPMPWCQARQVMLLRWTVMRPSRERSGAENTSIDLEQQEKQQQQQHHHHHEQQRTTSETTLTRMLASSHYRSEKKTMKNAVASQILFKHFAHFKSVVRLF